MKKLQSPPSLAELAYNKIHQSILTGKLKCGEIYQEIGLAQQLGISRTPVREALLELSTRGFVTFLPRKGVRINRLSIQDIEEVFELRRVLEVYIVENLASAKIPYDLSEVEKTLTKQELALQKNDNQTYISAGRSFHVSLARLVQNSLFVSIQQNIQDKIRLIALEAHSSPLRMQEAIYEHQLILDCIHKGQKVKARKAMQKHLKYTFETVVKQFMSNP